MGWDKPSKVWVVFSRRLTLCTTEDALRSLWHCLRIRLQFITHSSNDNLFAFYFFPPLLGFVVLSSFQILDTNLCLMLSWRRCHVALWSPLHSVHCFLCCGGPFSSSPFVNPWVNFLCNQSPFWKNPCLRLCLESFPPKVFQVYIEIFYPILIVYYISYDVIIVIITMGIERQHI